MVMIKNSATKLFVCLCKVGKINCPVLLVNGSDDQNWPASECAEDVSINRPNRS